MVDMSWVWVGSLLLLGSSSLRREQPSSWGVVVVVRFVK